jgi:hypothetical protein
MWNDEEKRRKIRNDGEKGGGGCGMMRRIMNDEEKREGGCGMMRKKEEEDME